MTKEEYNFLYTELSPFIGKDFKDNKIVMILRSIEDYEEGIGEHPKAIFDQSIGSVEKMPMDKALSFIKKHQFT